MQLKKLEVDMRVELHPASDRRRRGCLYGTIMSIDNSMHNTIWVELDLTGRVVKVHPREILRQAAA